MKDFTLCCFLCCEIGSLRTNYKTGQVSSPVSFSIEHYIVTDGGFLATAFKPYNMLFAACAIAGLCLLSVSSAVPLACEDLVRPLDQVDHFEGRWVLVAGSLNNTAAEDILKGRDSVVVYLHNSSYIQASHVGGHCIYERHNMSTEGHIFTIKEKNFNFTVTLSHTSCQDCAVMTLDMEAPKYKSTDLYLFSKRREVDQKEMDEFNAQVKCLKLPLPVVMDPTKEICPDPRPAKK